MDSYQFCWDFEVRDYECDLTGIVNNANYQHYLEHSRHMYLRKQGVDFTRWFERGVTLVVVRIELDFLHPLRSGDRFRVGLNAYRVSRLRFGFDQDIYREPDDKLILKGKIVGTALNQLGKPDMPEELVELMIGNR